MKKIAILGYSTRLPATNDARFWQDLLAGRDLITEVAADRWALAALQHPRRNHPGTAVTFAAGSLGDVAGFDAAFFHISPREAAAIDPQQRLLLEMSWEALCRAGQDPRRLRGSLTGVFLGLASTDYGYRLAEDLAGIGPNTATGVTASIAANRISYVYDLRGPSLVVDTACSSALVAFHLACRSILAGECDLALTGAINLHLHPFGFLIFSQASMLSTGGRCRPFAEGADGYVRAEGGGVFVLKDYEQARRDGDPILAVVLATGVNTDGAKSGLTVPSATAQANLLQEVYRRAGLDPAELAYLEAHGTGTAVGDPVEVEAIGRALGRERAADSPLPIGSVKGNLGHLETASGIPGLLKGIHVLRTGVVPPTRGIQQLNSQLPLEELHLHVVQETLTLDAAPRRHVGVNSFGFGGANAHVLLMSPTPRRTRKVPWPRQQRRALPLPLFLSAQTETALRRVAQDFAAVLTGEPAADYARIYQANFRSPRLRQGLILRGASAAELRQQLQAFADGAAVGSTGQTLAAAKGPVFVYSGNGCQWIGMGKALLRDPVFLQTLEEIDQYFLPLARYSLRADLAGELGDGERYHFTEFAQPALFALQVGMTQSLQALGIQPQAVLGHSVGEVAAAWASSILSLEDAVQVIYHRSRLQATTRGVGAMTALALAADAAVEQIQAAGLADQVELAAWNSANGCTIAGDVTAISTLEGVLRQRGVAHKRLPIDYAFHSRAMDPIRDDLLQGLQTVRAQRARVPFFSVVTGALVDGEELTAGYWWQNIRAPVRFLQAAQEALEAGNCFVELGGHPVLRGYLQELLQAAPQEGWVLATLQRNEQRSDLFWETASQLWLAGLPRDWQAFFPKVADPVELPPYPWERERHWQEATPESARVIQRYAVHPLLGHPVAQHPGEWEQEIDLERIPWLADHCVGDGVVFPGAAYAEVFLAAARERFPDAHSWSVESMEILQPLLLEAGQSKILCLRLEEDGHARIAARRQLEAEWTLHAKARLTASAEPVQCVSTPSELETPRQNGTPAEHLALTRRAGLQYGPAFQTVQRLAIGEDRVMAELALSSTSGEGFVLHPTLLDGALQLCADWLARQEFIPEGWGFVPTRVERLRLSVAGASTLTATVYIRRRTPQSLLIDVQLSSPSGQPVAELEGVRLRRLRLLRGEEERLQFFRNLWIPAPLAEHALAPLSAQTWMDAWALAELADVERYRIEGSPLSEALVEAYLEEAERGSAGEVSAAEIWHTLLRDDAELFPIFLAIGRWGLALRGEGESEAPSRTFGEIATETLLAPLRRALQKTLPTAIAAWLAELPSHRPLRIAPLAVSGDSAWDVILAAQRDPRVQRDTSLADLLLLEIGAVNAARGTALLELAASRAAPQALLLLLGVNPEPWWRHLDSQTGDCLGLEEAVRLLETTGWELLSPLREDLGSVGAGLCALRWKEETITALPRAENDLRCCLWAGSSPAVAQQQAPAVWHLLAPSLEQLETAPLEQPVSALVYAVDLGKARDLAEECATLLRWCRWAIRQERPPQLWLLVGGQAPADDSSHYPSDVQRSALVGFFRSLGNEWPTLRPCAIVQEHELRPALLFAEMQAASGETEIRHDTQGYRWVARLQRESLPHNEPVDAFHRLGFAQPGQLRHLQWEIETTPELPADEVSVRVDYAGLNFRDVMYALGMLPDEALESGFTGPALGLEFSGEVVDVGAAVTRFRSGDRVLGFASGAFSERVQTPETAILPLPEALSSRAAASIPTVFFTAWYALRHCAHLQAGERVLIHGAAGGVGIAAIQIAQLVGAEVFATAGSPEKRDFLRLLGVKRIYNSRTLDFAEEIRRDTQGKGVDVVLNSLSGAAMERSLQLLQPGGRFLELGKRDFYEDTPLGLRPFRNNLSYFGIDADQLLHLQPNLTQKMFSTLLAHFAQGELFALPSTPFPAAQVVDAFRYMQQARQIGKVLVDLSSPMLPERLPRTHDWPNLAVDPDAWYLVTGGTRGFGLATADRLLQRGARHLLLLSRSGTVPSYEEARWQQMQKWGADLRCLAVDLSQGDHLGDTLAAIRTEGRPIRGVVHAAAVIADALAENLDLEGIRAVVAPKLAGAWNAHRCTLSDPLDFFVLYSSISATLGNPGQAAYAAANAGLEALSRWRRSQALPALTVAWGAIADSGYLVQHQQTAEFLERRLGAAAIRSDIALDVLEALLASKTDGYTVADLNVAVLQRHLPAANVPRLQGIFPEGGEEYRPAEGMDLRSQLDALDAAAAEAVLVEQLRQAVGEILRLEPERIAPDQALTELGLDSLMGVELVMALEDRLGIKLPSFLLQEGPSIQRLARRLVEQMQSALGNGDDEAEQFAEVLRQHGVAEEAYQKP